MIGSRKAPFVRVALAALLSPALLAQGVAGAAVAPIQPSTSTLASGTAGYCRSDTGVTVVVDFQALGGPVVVRCAPGPVEPGFSGVDALQQAGFTPTGTARWGLQFVCRINGRPGPEETLPVRDDPDYQEKCQDTPPQSAYWGYWYADNGGSWRYSNEGAASHDAIPGGFEGWAFSLNGARPQPGVAPRRPASSPSSSPSPSPSPSPTPTPQASAPSPSPSRPPASSPSPAAPSSSPDGSDTRPASGDRPSTAPVASSASTSAPAGVRTELPSGTGAAQRPPKPSSRDKRTPKPPASPSASSSPSPTTTPVTGSPTSGDVQVTGDLPASPDAPDPGSPRALLAGLAVLAALTAGAGVTAWRRSRQG